MNWFPASERGLALGIRQTAVPVGGLMAALVLPTLDLRAAFLFLARCVLPARCSARRCSGSAWARGRRPSRAASASRCATTPLARSAGERLLPRRAARGARLPRALPARRARLLAARRPACSPAVHVLRRSLRIGGGPLVGRDRLAAAAAAAGRSREQCDPRAGRDAARCAARPSRAGVPARRRASRWRGTASRSPPPPRSRARPQRRRDRVPADGTRRGRRARAAGFAAMVGVTSWRLAFAAAAVFPLAGVQLLRPLRS